MKIKTIHELQALARARRRELAQSQEVLAKRAGVSRKWVSEFELGKVNPEMPQVFRVLEALGLTMDVAPADAVATAEPDPPVLPPIHNTDLGSLIEGQFDR